MNNVPILRNKLSLSFLALVFLSAVPAKADVRLPNIFSDNMMMQRGMPVRVWGWADADETVNVSIAAHVAATKADSKGQWSVELPAL